MAVIGQNLSGLRKSKGLTRATVAYHANISMTTLYKLETGKCGNVGIWALFDLCKYYDIKPYTVLIEGRY
ncbi:helix-turn-helix domain-containing protein [Pseudobacter ginsenosidimutans]|uniref:Helix-turn-helix protein n=1 Tax=Pseudobacter ginsenosidimutans TaxID=661488 RepID=A0A4Q7N4E8_9BACT|nr:helix-turn-helix transcriptional regulator [Pseudobacter ginsenosidimutans]RZS75868.1 helix-turn-helix protein [Pseudobacter ginsenosidimutans]